MGNMHVIMGNNCSTYNLVDTSIRKHLYPPNLLKISKIYSTQLICVLRAGIQPNSLLYDSNKLSQGQAFSASTLIYLTLLQAMNKSGVRGELSEKKQDRERARINPEFQGIGKQFVQTHYRRRSIQLEQRQVANRVAFLQKEHETTQKRLEQKQADLDRLMAVIDRKRADQERRQQLREQREAAVAMQRQQNLRRRHQHQERLRNAYLSLYDERKDASDDLRRTFNNHDNLRQSFKAEELLNKRDRVLSISSEKQEGKKRVDSYFKARNDSFTETYKQKISRERQEAERTARQIQELNELQGSLKLKLENSSSKLSQVAGRYEQTYRVHANRSALSVPNSRSYLIKESRNKETKQQSNNEPDPKVEHLISKQLSFATAIKDI